MNKEFRTYALNPHGVRLAKDIADIFDKVLDELSTYCPAGREWSLVKTQLESACFYCKKSMATDPKNQIDES